MSEQTKTKRPTEIDQLLPAPVTNRRPCDGNTDANDQCLLYGRSVILAGAAILVLALAFSVHVVFSSSAHPSPGNHHQHENDASDFKPKQQLSALQHLTENSLMGVLPASANVTPSKRKNQHPKGKVDVVSYDKRKHDNKEYGVFHCTSQVMIMRHCDKEVKVIINGKKRTIDNRDKHGDGHCSAKGERRSEYIATIFVDANEYQKLMEKKGREFADGIPPVPMVKSSLTQVGSSAAPKKPQFPPPLHIYALSSARHKDNSLEEHKNFREIETITPLSKKFHLDVDDRFGINEEGALASDFFENLSNSVVDNIQTLTRRSNATGPSAAWGKSSLCDSGMTVVNWKHSRIPVLARALGCGTNEGCPMKYKRHDYDTVWLLTFQYTLPLVPSDLDVESSALALELLSKPASLRHHKKKAHSSGYGNWKISAELVNEGFDVS